jgi:hypothetical protein
MIVSDTLTVASIIDCVGSILHPGLISAALFLAASKSPTTKEVPSSINVKVDHQLFLVIWERYPFCLWQNWGSKSSMVLGVRCPSDIPLIAGKVFDISRT